MRLMALVLCSVPIESCLTGLPHWMMRVLSPPLVEVLMGGVPMLEVLMRGPLREVLMWGPLCEVLMRGPLREVLMGERCSCFPPELYCSSSLGGYEPSPSHLSSLSGPLPLGQAPLQRTHGSRLANRGGSSFMKHGIPCCWLESRGKVRHAQGQKLNRFELR